MRLIIDIPNEDYQGIVNDAEVLPQSLTHYERIIKNGTPLPEGHGRLVDMSEVLIKLMQYYDGDKTIGQCLDEVNTIIEADGGDAE